jgi:hypothetical protein
MAQIRCVQLQGGGEDVCKSEIYQAKATGSTFTALATKTGLFVGNSTGGWKKVVNDRCLSLVPRNNGFLVATETNGLAHVYPEPSGEWKSDSHSWIIGGKKWKKFTLVGVGFGYVFAVLDYKRMIRFKLNQEDEGPIEITDKIFLPCDDMQTRCILKIDTTFDYGKTKSVSIGTNRGLFVTTDGHDWHSARRISDESANHFVDVCSHRCDAYVANGSGIIKYASLLNRKSITGSQPTVISQSLKSGKKSFEVVAILDINLNDYIFIGTSAKMFAARLPRGNIDPVYHELQFEASPIEHPEPYYSSVAYNRMEQIIYITSLRGVVAISTKDVVEMCL